MMRRTLEGAPHGLRLQNLLWRSFSQTLLGAQQPHRREDTLNQGQVMHGGEDRDPSGTQRADQIGHFQLPSNIEVLGRFIEEKKPRLLGETKRNLDALTFPAAQLIEDAPAERSRIGKLPSLPRLPCGPKLAILRTF